MALAQAEHPQQQKGSKNTHLNPNANTCISAGETEGEKKIVDAAEVLFVHFRFTFAIRSRAHT